MIVSFLDSERSDESIVFTMMYVILCLYIRYIIEKILQLSTQWVVYD